MEPEEVLEQEVTQEEPAAEEIPAENVQTEPESGQENAQGEPEPAIVRTGGKWEDFEEATEQELEIGKTYHIKARGRCEFMISEKKPTAGIATNEITFKKQEGIKLWIKTGV